MKIVLQKFISQSGFCSRRQAEQLIRDGKVQISGQPAELGMKADEKDEVRIYGKKITPAKDKIYIMLNKPAGYTCTNREFPGEKNVFELIDGANTNVETNGRLSLRGKRLFIVGRLDKESRGLVLLTNDGNMALKLTHPRYQSEKEYEAKFKIQNSKFKTNDLILKFKNGIDIGEGDGVAKAKDIKFSGDNKFKIILTEGKKRQIRRMFKVLGYEVADILRIRIGNLKLDNLPEGRWRYLNDIEIKNLK